MTPYISFVVTSRNDDHGGDMRKRMNIFVKGLIHQCNKYHLPSELVLVDWNSPDPNQLLHTVLPKALKSDYLNIRYIVVPPEIHDKYDYSDRLGLFQMIAKNVGIRRSLGQFIVCTNVDLLFSDGLFERFAKQDLKEGVFYRANRCDIPNDIDEHSTVEEQLKFAEKNILKRLGKHAQFPMIQKFGRALTKKKMYWPFLVVLSSLKKIIIGKKQVTIYNLDFDACGDFTLMSRVDWERIKGYAELEMYSLHIDSMALFEAASKGIQQEIFPMYACTYHIAHDGGWEFADPIEKLHFFRERPSLEWWAVWVAGSKIVEEKSTFDINDDNWGLNNVELREICN